jgi:hypothetical protein
MNVQKTSKTLQKDGNSAMSVKHLSEVSSTCTSLNIYAYSDMKTRNFCIVQWLFRMFTKFLLNHMKCFLFGDSHFVISWHVLWHWLYKQCLECTVVLWNGFFLRILCALRRNLPCLSYYFTVLIIIIVVVIVAVSSNHSSPLLEQKPFLSQLNIFCFLQLSCSLAQQWCICVHSLNLNKLFLWFKWKFHCSTAYNKQKYLFHLDMVAFLINTTLYGSLCDLCAVLSTFDCLTFMKLGMYIMTSEPV